MQDGPSTQSDLLLSGDDEGSENESATDILSETTTQSEDLEIDNSRTDLPSEMTMQPAQSVALVDKWLKNPPTLNEFPFLEADGMDIDIPENADAMFFLKLLLFDDFIEQIVQSSNAYAESVISANRPTQRRSMLNEWKDVTAEEMKKFFGVILHMGLFAMPSYKCYWSTSPFYKNEFFTSVMSRARFEAILHFLYFGENPKFPNDRLAKVRLLVDHLNNTMSNIFTPGENCHWMNP